MRSCTELYFLQSWTTARLDTIGQSQNGVEHDETISKLLIKISKKCLKEHFHFNAQVSSAGFLNIHDDAVINKIFDPCSNHF